MGKFSEGLVKPGSRKPVAFGELGFRADPGSKSPFQTPHCFPGYRMPTGITPTEIPQKYVRR